MDELVKSNVLTPIDGYDDDGGGPSARGARYVKFDGATQHLWFLREDGSVLSPGPYYAPDCWEEHIKWIDKLVADRIRKQSGEAFPDLDKLNEQAPKSEWGEDFNGAPVGPWRHTFNVGLVNIDNGERLIVSNSTVGMALAYEALRDSVRFMRVKRGERVVPVVELDSAAMRTKKFGVKLRPSFKVVDWITFGGSAIPVIAAPIAPLSAGEIVNDKIPDHPAPEPVRGGPKRRKKVGVAEPIPGLRDPDDDIPF